MATGRHKAHEEHAHVNAQESKQDLVYPRHGMLVC